MLGLRRRVCHSRIASFIIFIRLAIGLPATASSDVCPLSCVTLGLDSIDSSCSDVASRDTSASLSKTGNSFQRAQFTIPRGLVTVAAEGYSDVGEAVVSLRDRFQLLGTTPGVPITFSARLHIEQTGTCGCFPGDACISASGEAVLAEGDHLINYFPACTGAHDLVLPIQTASGESFEMWIYLKGTAGSDSRFYQGRLSATGALTFLDLPDGARVVSCNGYASDWAVPVRRTTWGRLKMLYRP
jgi:hypothetical protein